MWIGPTRLDGTPLNEPGGAVLIAMLLERTIPPRLRLSTHEWFVRQSRYLATPKRRLFKELYSGSRKLGRPFPRGYVFPDQSAVAEAGVCHRFRQSRIGERD